MQIENDKKLKNVARNQKKGLKMTKKLIRKNLTGFAKVSMYKSLILPSAKRDIEQAARWYDKKLKGLGKRFIGEVREKVNFIKQNPEACNLRYDNVRTAVLNVFPFMIHYVIDEINKYVIIIAVLLTSRNPDLWKHK